MRTRHALGVPYGELSRCSSVYTGVAMQMGSNKTAAVINVTTVIDIAHGAGINRIGVTTQKLTAQR